MHWRCVLEKDGEVIQATEGDIPNPPLLSGTNYMDLSHIDPFGHIAQYAAAHSEPSARISVTVQHSLAYSEVKVSFTITVSCPQTKDMMDYTAEHAFIQATKYVNNSMQFLAPGIQPLLVPNPSR